MVGSANTPADSRLSRKQVLRQILTSMESTSHLPILKRAGVVLLVIGLIDIGVMVYCIANSISYSSSVNIFAVFAGICLLRGNLRVAVVVRWIAIFLLVGFFGMLLVWPLIQPIDLTLTQWRLDPLGSLASLALMIFWLVLLLWLNRELGSAPVLEARAAAGRKPRDMRIPAAVGVGTVVTIVVLLNMLFGGESAAKAEAMARQQFGPAYRYHISSMHIGTSSTGTRVAATVTAWNEKEIKTVSFSWSE
jgi:hypothetical protein